MAPKPNENSGNVLADIGLNIISKKIKKGLSKFQGSGIALTNNDIISFVLDLLVSC